MAQEAVQEQVGNRSERSVKKRAALALYTHDLLSSAPHIATSRFLQALLAPLHLRLHQAEEAQLHHMTKSLLDPSKIMLKDKMAFVIGGCTRACLRVQGTLSSSPSSALLVGAGK